MTSEIEYKIGFDWTLEIDYDITRREYKTCFSAHRLIDADHRDPKRLTSTVLMEALPADHAEVMSDEEIAYYVLEQILTFENHEAREWFRWKGAPDLSPHHMDEITLKQQQDEQTEADYATLQGQMADFDMRDPTK